MIKRMSIKRNGKQMTNATLISPELIPIKIRRSQVTGKAVSGCSSGD